MRRRWRWPVLPNVPTERAATLVQMLFRQSVQTGGRETADEPTDPGNSTVVEKAQGKAVKKAKPGAPHVLVTRTPDERLVWLSGLRSRRHEEVTAFLRGYTGFLIVDGFRGYQGLLTCERPVPATPDGVPVVVTAA
jgi:hypothetical protein